MFTYNKTVSAFKLAEGIESKILAKNKTLMIVENTFNKGAKASIHKHDNEQAGYILSGKFEVTIDGISQILLSGDSFTVNKNIPHSCTAIEMGVILDIFTPIREDLIHLSKS